MKKLTILSIIILLALVGVKTGLATSVTDTVSISATVAQGTNSLDVTPATWSWGSLPAANATTYRFSSGRNSGSWTAPGALSVSFFPAAPYEIRVYTDHDVGASATDARGYLVNGSYKVYLKVWCKNFGAPTAPEDQGPDPMNSYFWNGYDFNGDGDKEDVVADGTTKSESTLGFDLNGDGDTSDTITSTGSGGGYVSSTEYELGEAPCWLWMLEQDTMQEGVDGTKEYTRRRLSYNYPSDADLGSPFKVHLAMDLRGVAAGSYTGTPTFELYTY